MIIVSVVKLKMFWEYELAINFHKTCIFFSSNFPSNVRDHISSVLDVHNSIDHGRYLGWPSLIGRNKKNMFSFLKDRLWKQMSCLNGKFLSRAGKEILLKSIA